MNEHLCGSNEHPPLVPRTLGILEPGSAFQTRPERVGFGQHCHGPADHRTFQLPHSPFEAAARRIPYGANSPYSWAGRLSMSSTEIRMSRMIGLPPNTSGWAVMCLRRSCSVVAGSGSAMLGFRSGWYCRSGMSGSSAVFSAVLRKDHVTALDPSCGLK